MAQYTPSTAKANMNDLIKGLEKKYKELGKYINRPELTPSQEADVNNQMVKLVIDIHHRKQMAAFEAASATVVRPPTAAEVTNLQKTLTDLGKDINSLATFQMVIKFVENVMTQNAQRFTDIVKTIRT